MIDQMSLSHALSLYEIQSRENPVYRSYLQAIGRLDKQAKSWTDIPFLPIDLYKNHEVKTGVWASEIVFRSSGTTEQTIRSQHHVRSLSAYRQHARQLFESTYGSCSDYVLLALLPGYSEGSSLVTMVRDLIDCSGHVQSRFISGPSEFETLQQILEECLKSDRQVILFGVTFSLLEFAEWNTKKYSNSTVIETGGMKGRREEWTRAQVHEMISTSLGTTKIHSEYGMTELMSQAYSTANGIFRPNRFLKILPGDLYDPLSGGLIGQNSRLNLIDLGNADTCAFIATNDIGRVYEDGTFEVLGRMDYAELRGCNLLTVT